MISETELMEQSARSQEGYWSPYCSQNLSKGRADRWSGASKREELPGAQRKVEQEIHLWSWSPSGEPSRNYEHF